VRKQQRLRPTVVLGETQIGARVEQASSQSFCCRYYLQLIIHSYAGRR